MYALIFDTETTGKANFKAPAVDPCQPTLVQLGALLVDVDEREDVASVDLIVFPSNWTIPQDAAMVHGITQGKAERVGVNLDTAVNAFRDLLDMADVGVAHNIVFDKLVMERAAAMVNLAMEEE